MDTKVTNFIDILCDNSILVKHYKALNNLDDSFDYSTWEFDENDFLSNFYVENDRTMAFLCNAFMAGEGNYYSKRILLNGQWRTKNLDEFLHSAFAEFRTSFTKNNYWDEISIKDEAYKRISETKYYLLHLVHQNNRNGVRLIDSLFKVKYEYLIETIRFIENPLIVINNQIEQKQIKPKKVLENLTKLTQNQVVILFYYLRELEFVGKGISNNLYAQHISELTGFSEEKIRQDLSHIKNDSNSTDGGQFIEANYSAVRRVLDLVTNKIKAESEERFS